MTEDRLRTERDQYAAAIRQLILQVKQTAYVWSQTMPETLRTADVTKALGGLCSPLPLPEGLRDDLWQRIAGAYYLRFENDGHPEDSKAAADMAVSLVQSELDRLESENARMRQALEGIREYAEARCTEEHANVASASWIVHLVENLSREKETEQS